MNNSEAHRKESLIAKILEINSVFLEETSTKDILQTAINEYCQLLFAVANLDFRGNEENENIVLENGVAIGTKFAAICVRDGLRTPYFMRGIFKAVDDALKLKGGKIHIFYAGTGPFATLILPILAHYSPEQVSCSLMEINELSINYLKRVMDILGFTDRIENYIHDDATKYKFSHPEEIDILLSETMMRGLTKEQQVPIVLNLLPQLRKDVIMIPEEVELSVALMNSIKMANRVNIPKHEYWRDQGNFFILNQESIRHFATLIPRPFDNWRFEEKILSLTLEDMKGMTSLAVLTRLQVYADVELPISESELTLPLWLQEISDVKENIRMTVAYKLEEEGKIDYLIKEESSYSEV